MSRGRGHDKYIFYKYVVSKAIYTSPFVSGLPISVPQKLASKLKCQNAQKSVIWVLHLCMKCLFVSM